MILEITSRPDGTVQLRTRFCTYLIEDDEGEITLSAPGLSRTVLASDFPEPDLRAIGAYLIVSLEYTLWGNT